MKRLILGVAAALLLAAGPAAADGLPSKGQVRAAPEAAAGPNWNGFYVGVGIGAGALVADKHTYFQNCEFEICGYTYGDNNQHTISDREYGGEGLFGTVTIGYDRVLRPGWVAGVFADYDFGSSVSSEGEFLGLDFSIDHNYSWAVGARLGFLVNPSTLIYGTAGYTQAEFEPSLQHVSGLYSSPTFDGYFVGAGIETFLRPNWTLKLEYRYSDFGSETINAADCWEIGSDLEPSMHTARLVLSYRFGHHH